VTQSITGCIPTLERGNDKNDGDLKEFVDLQAGFTDSDKSWTFNIEDVDQNTFDLSSKNPNKEEAAPLREPQEILAEIAELDMKSAKVLEEIRGML